MKEDTETVVLWRPTGPEELALVEASGWREWPPRLPEQPIFYPVLNKEYATQIARDWNVPASDSGYVTRFEVRSPFSAATRCTGSAVSRSLSTRFPPRIYRR